MNNAWDYSLDTFIESLSSRPRNALKSEFRSFHNEYSQAYMKPPHTLRHLLMYTKGELMRIPNLGKHSIQEIDEALAEHGLHLYEKHTQKSLASLLDYQPKTEPIGWLRAVDEEMVSTHLGVADITDSYEDAKRKLKALICWHVDVSHDPKVNGSAQQPRKAVKLTPDEKLRIALDCNMRVRTGSGAVKYANAVEDAFIAKNRMTE